MAKINFETIENINVDCIIGLGPDCRVGVNLKRNGRENVVNPFNWIGFYSLNDAVMLMKKKGEGFFENYSFSPENDTEKTLAIIDNDTNILSVHDFKKEFSNKTNDILFKHKYRLKFKALDKILHIIQYPCIITSRKINIEEIEVFIEKFSKLYSFKHLYYINIYDDKNENFIKFEKNNFTVFQYFFNDEHVNGRDKITNPNFWLGNIEYWDKIINKIQWNKIFYKEHIDKQEYKNSIDNLRCKLNK